MQAFISSQRAIFSHFSGKCICEHNTAGDNCEKCAPGWYGYALAGTEDDCQKCPCPNDGECVELLNNEVVCINCQEGYTGRSFLVLKCNWS